MNELINLIRDNFYAFVEAMLYFPAELQIWHWYEAAILIFFLVVGVAVVFLCAWLTNIYNLGFLASTLVAFLVLSLTLGLIGILLSIPRLSVSALDTFLVVCIGSPGFSLVLGMLASLGSSLRKNNPIVGTLVLCVAGFLFAWVLLTTFILFVFRLVIT